MDNKVTFAPCASYSEEDIRKAFDEILTPLGDLDFIKPGMTVAIKLNLVTMMKPDKAATTHPACVKELCRRITEKGANAVIGDSPGGPFTGIYLSRVYSVCGLTELEREGVTLNRDFEASKEEKFTDAAIMKSFEYTSWLKKADCIINFAKLKTHGMMGLSCAVKNMFGAIPGTVKPEYHFRYPNAKDFADMLIDLNRYFKPVFNIVDAVVGMEGNGPTMGKPRFIGGMLASANPYNLDCVCAHIIGLDEAMVPTLECAIDAGLGAKYKDIEIIGDPASIDDFQNIEKANSIEFLNELVGFKGKIFGKIAKAAMCSRPKLTPRQCIGCKKCNDICPAKAITMKKGKPDIDRSKCIRCFCCQEFCPKGALKVHRPAIAKLLTKL